MAAFLEKGCTYQSHGCCVAQQPNQLEFTRMSEKPYPSIAHRPELSQLDPADLTTEALIARARDQRGQVYTSEQLLAVLPETLRGLCDYLLSLQASPLNAAARLAAVIEAIENRRTT